MMYAMSLEWLILSGQISMVRKVTTKSGRKIPAKYLAGLTGEAKRKRLAQLEKMQKEGRLLGELAGDKDSKGKRKKTPESPYTKAFRRRFGGSKNK